MNAKRKPPKPIIDNLEFIGNPFQKKHFSTKLYIEDPIKRSELDLEYALKFLYSYNGSTATFNSYRREIERLLQWSWQILNTSVITLKREHIEDFIKFCINPPVAWIGIKNVARFKNEYGDRVVNPDWRPFVISVSKTDFAQGIEPDRKKYVASQSSIKATFTALSSFYDYLCQENLIDANPVALIRQKSKFVRKDQTQPMVRRISNLQWEYVIETAQLLASENPDEHERTLFIIMCLLSMYLRISELVADERSAPKMGDFKRDLDGHWWFYVTGKGNKDRKITVCDDMLKALKRYRRYLKLSATPSPEDNTPLISKIKGKGPVTSTRHIRKIVQMCFDQTFERMKNEGMIDDAMELKSATVHWLRHTGISEDVKIRPREHVRDDAGHSSMATTDRYIESDSRERHASGKKKRINEIH